MKLTWCYNCENYTKSCFIVRGNSHKVYCQICGELISNVIRNRKVVRKVNREKVNTFWLFVVVGLMIIGAIYGH